MIHNFLTQFWHPTTKHQTIKQTNTANILNNGTKADANTNTQNGTPDSDLALKVENLGKRYRLIDPASKADQLNNLWDYIALPWRRFKEIRSLTNFKEDDDENIFWALRDITFELKQGEVLGIIGRNGAGKSTLLKILSRITAPSEGRAVINGRVNSLLEVGTGFKGTLTGRENVYMNGTIHGMSKKEIDDKLPEIAEFAGLEEGFLDIPVKRYSSGMKVRLGFAVAAHLEPEILIVDEVLAVGDAAFKRKCMGKMDDVTQQGRTVILVSHSMDNILNLCDRVLWLHEGQVMMDDEASVVVDKYIESFRENEGKKRIGERTDRRGDQSYYVDDFWMTDGNGAEKEILSCGDNVVLNFLVKKNCRKSIDVTFSMAFQDLNGRVIFSCSSKNHEKTTLLSKDETVVSIHIPKFQLTSGTYFISCTMIEHKAGQKIYVDKVKDAAELSVQPGNYYGVGQEYLGEQKSVFMTDFDFFTDNELIKQ